MEATVTFLGEPVPVKLKEYVPFGKFVVVKAMLPFVPPQVVGFVTVPAAIVGEFGSDKAFKVASVPAQPFFAMLKPL